MKKIITNLLASLLIVSSLLLVGCKQDPPADPPSNPPPSVASIKLEQTYKAEYTLVNEDGDSVDESVDYFKFHEDGSVSFYNTYAYLTMAEGEYTKSDGVLIWHHTIFDEAFDIQGLAVYTLTETTNGIICDLKFEMYEGTYSASNIKLEEVQDVVLQDGVYAQKYNTSGEVEEDFALAIYNGKFYSYDCNSSYYAYLGSELASYIGPYLVLTDESSYTRLFIDTNASIDGDSRNYLYMDHEEIGYLLYESFENQELGFKASHTLTSKMYKMSLEHDELEDPENGGDIGSSIPTITYELLDTIETLTLYSTGAGRVAKGSGRVLYVDAEGKEWRGDWFIVGASVLVRVQEVDGTNINEFVVMMLEGDELTEESFIDNAYTITNQFSMFQTYLTAWGDLAKEYFDSQIEGE